MADLDELMKQLEAITAELKAAKEQQDRVGGLPDNPNHVWEDCGNVQCRQVHETLDSLLEMLGIQCAPNIYTIGKALRITEAILKLQEENNAHCACQHDGKGNLTTECEFHEKCREDSELLDWIQRNKADIDWEDGRCVVYTEHSNLGSGASKGAFLNVRDAIRKAILNAGR